MLRQFNFISPKSNLQNNITRQYKFTSYYFNCFIYSTKWAYVQLITVLVYGSSPPIEKYAWMNSFLKVLEDFFHRTPPCVFLVIVSRLCMVFLTILREKLLIYFFLLILLCHVHVYSQHSSIIWPVWLNSWAFVCELSGCGFESICSHLNFRFRDRLEQGVPWHSGNYIV